MPAIKKTNAAEKRLEKVCCAGSIEDLERVGAAADIVLEALHEQLYILKLWIVLLIDRGNGAAQGRVIEHVIIHILYPAQENADLRKQRDTRVFAHKGVDSFHIGADSALLRDAVEVEQEIAHHLSEILLLLKHYDGLADDGTFIDIGVRLGRGAGNIDQIACTKKKALLKQGNGSIQRRIGMGKADDDIKLIGLKSAAEIGADILMDLNIAVLSAVIKAAYGLGQQCRATLVRSADIKLTL